MEYEIVFSLGNTIPKSELEVRFCWIKCNQSSTVAKLGIIDILIRSGILAF